MAGRHLTPLTWVDAIARAGSIRKAAETLAINSTALNRRVLALEEELGVQIFERLPRGVRLSTAGELLIAHIRAQISDYEKLKSQIADLSGERRGHVGIACSQALLPFFLPEQISRYRAVHPAVTFGVNVRDRTAAEQALVDLSADVALVFEPVRVREIQVLISVRQRIHAVMAADHPLAERETIRLRDCAAFPIGLPTAQYGVRHLMDIGLMRASVELDCALEADSFEFLRRYPRHERMVTFQIPVGLPGAGPQGGAAGGAARGAGAPVGPEANPVAGAEEGVVARPVDPRDVPEGRLHLCQLRGRTLPVAAAKFAAQMEEALEDRYE